MMRTRELYKKYDYVIQIMILFMLGILSGSIIFWFKPFTPIEISTVNVTDVWFMNSGIMVWGYWDNSTVEDCMGLFQSGFSHNDIGFTYRVHFKEWPNEDIRCLKLIKKVLVK